MRQLSQLLEAEIVGHSPARQLAKKVHGPVPTNDAVDEAAGKADDKADGDTVTDQVAAVPDASADVIDKPATALDAPAIDADSGADGGEEDASGAVSEASNNEVRQRGQPRGGQA